MQTHERVLVAEAARFRDQRDGPRRPQASESDAGLRLVEQLDPVGSQRSDDRGGCFPASRDHSVEPEAADKLSRAPRKCVGEFVCLAAGEPAVGEKGRSEDEGVRRLGRLGARTEPGIEQLESGAEQLPQAGDLDTIDLMATADDDQDTAGGHRAAGLFPGRREESGSPGQGHARVQATPPIRHFLGHVPR
jgi:hypothetical protein